MFRNNPLRIYGAICAAGVFASAIAKALGEAAIGEWLFWVALALGMAAGIAGNYQKQLPPKEHEVNALHDRIAESVERTMDDERRR